MNVFTTNSRGAGAACGALSNRDRACKDLACKAGQEFMRTAAGHQNVMAALSSRICAKRATGHEKAAYEILSRPPLESIPKQFSEDDLYEDEKAAMEAFGLAADKAILLERMGGSIPDGNRKVLDIKIGRKTTLLADLLRHGMNEAEARAKATRFDGIDEKLGSARNGFRLEGQMGFAPLDPIEDRNDLAGSTLDHLGMAVRSLDRRTRQKNLENIHAMIGRVVAEVKDHEFALVSSSLLVTLDDRDPDAASVKLIDLDHLVLPEHGAGDYESARKNFLDGLESIQKTFAGLSLA